MTKLNKIMAEAGLFLVLLISALPRTAARGKGRSYSTLLPLPKVNQYVELIF